MEPSSSVPSDTGAKPAATPAALPDDEPAGPCLSISEMPKPEMNTNRVCEERAVFLYPTFNIGILRLLNQLSNFKLSVR